jgi:CheY-like chemotaxis protein
MQPKARVIIIDDDPGCRALLELLLKQKGYEVISLSDPTACPLYAGPQCTCPQDQACGDFLLTDNRMPGMTGIEFVERQMQRGCKGIIGNKAVLSGTWSEQELAQAKLLGCRVFDKPFKLNDIVAWMNDREQRILPGRKLVTFDSDHYER